MVMHSTAPRMKKKKKLSPSKKPVVRRMEVKKRRSLSVR
jgi:hypothetical protein